MNIEAEGASQKELNALYGGTFGSTQGRNKRHEGPDDGNAARTP
jgi:hypothetical protein